MNIIIHNASMQPIYEQIVDQIKGMVLDGSLREESPLPSVRILAKELKISALTVKKAYDTLEEAGFVVTIHGKGSYIAHTNTALLQEEHKKEVEADLEAVIRKGLSCGMKPEELQSLFKLIMEDMK